MNVDDYQFALIDPLTGVQSCRMAITDVLKMATPMPFCAMWRKTAVTQFTGDDNPQELMTNADNSNVGFHRFTLAEDGMSVTVEESGVYKASIRMQATKNDAGADTDSTAGQLLSNGGLTTFGLAVNWSQDAEVVGPGDDLNSAHDKTKLGFLKLVKGDVLSLNITDTFGNDVFGVQATLEWIGPIDLQL